MSLINDALKRASQAHKDQPTQPAEGPVMQPVPATAKPSKLPIILGLMALLVVIVGGAVWLLLGGNKPSTTLAVMPPVRSTNAFTTNSPAKKAGPATNATPQMAAAQTNTPRPVVHPLASATAPQPTPRAVIPETNTIATNHSEAPVAKVLPPSTNVAPSVPSPTPKPSPAIAQATPTNSPPSASTNAVPVPPPAPLGPFPVLRLKAIIYAGASPQVLINGSHLTLGDEIDGAKIVKIERTRITVKWNGQTRELLPE